MSWASIADGRSSWCERRRRSRSTTASRTICSRGCSSACARRRATDGVQPVVLPRVESQRAELASVPGFVVPERAIDAQSLIAYADLVISAGGTMNREAVALGTPVYTTFEGRLGAVDERLIDEGRLRKLSAGGARSGQARDREPIRQLHPRRRASQPSACAATRGFWWTCC